jgi:hypothetical protein
MILLIFPRAAFFPAKPATCAKMVFSKHESSTTENPPQTSQTESNYRHVSKVNGIVEMQKVNEPAELSANFWNSIGCREVIDCLRTLAPIDSNDIDVVLDEEFDGRLFVEYRIHITAPTVNQEPERYGGDS